MLKVTYSHFDNISEFFTSLAAILAVFTALFDVAFSYLFIEKWKERKYSQNLQRETSELERMLSDLTAKESQSQTILNDLSAKINERKARLLETSCPNCGREFATRNAVNAHLRGCS